MARRSKAREVTLQMLFLVDMNDEVSDEAIKVMIADQLKFDDLRELAWQLFSGTLEHRDELDKLIEGVAENWSLKRMAPTDRNALRLGAFEMLHFDTPHRVVMDETIELARKFGAANSSQFVNGILDKIMPRSN